MRVKPLTSILSPCRRGFRSLKSSSTNPPVEENPNEGLALPFNPQHVANLFNHVKLGDQPQGFLN
jgi:hypothetical protein